MPDPTPPRRSLFLSFEGIDGSGKSTQARMLVEALRARGHDVVAVREPGGTRLGEAVRSLLLDPAAEIGPRAEALLFSAARAQLVADVVEPSLARGAVVVADRFVDSTEAYQGAGRHLGDGPSLLGAVSSFATGGRMPDRTYFVDVALDVAASRRSRRRMADRIERAGPDFQARVAEAYRQIAGRDGPRVLRVDGTGDVREAHATILQDALDLVGVGRPDAPNASRPRGHP